MSATVIARFVGSLDEAAAGAPVCVTPRLDCAETVVAAEATATRARENDRRMSKLSETLRELWGNADFAHYEYAQRSNSADNAADVNRVHERE
jgi:hypothetical protein